MYLIYFRNQGDLQPISAIRSKTLAETLVIRGNRILELFFRSSTYLKDSQVIFDLEGRVGRFWNPPLKIGRGSQYLAVEVTKPKEVRHEARHR